MVAIAIGAAQAVQGARVHQNKRVAQRAVGRQQVTRPRCNPGAWTGRAQEPGARALHLLRRLPANPN